MPQKPFVPDILPINTLFFHKHKDYKHIQAENGPS